MTDDQIPSPDMTPAIRTLEGGTLHQFGAWPAKDLEVGPSGVYTIWMGSTFLYVGMSWTHRTATGNSTAKGVFGRLASHASGRRSGDQFCIYICDRFVIPQLDRTDLAALADGQRILDGRTRQFIAEHLSFRVMLTANGHDARSIETTVRRLGLPRAGRPLINP